MKKQLLLIFAILTTTGLYAQQYVPITSINFVSQANLLACNDTSSYLGDTVKTRGIVIIDGNLGEVASSSVQGGHRPFIHIVDTANGGAMNAFSSIELMGVYTNSTGGFQVPATFTQVVAGDIVEITGVVGEFNNSNQLSLLDANSFSVVGSASSAPTPAVVPVGDLNDPNRVNILATGQQWEGAFVELQSVTVTEVVFFGGNRVSINVVDANGNKINLSDRYLAQKLPTHQTVNPNSPQTTGSFVPPVPGTFYTYIRGVVRHDANGCTGGTGRGFEINPFDSTHYNIGFAPPFIDQVERDPKIPTSTQTVDVDFNITDFDGTVDSVYFYWSDDSTKLPSQFTKTLVTPNAGSTDDYTFSLPARPNNTFVRYYITAIDNESNKSFYPSTPINQVEPNVDYYFVRNNGLKIFDLQFSLDASGNSPFLGEEVTVTGIVTASTKLWDIGYLYVQDENGGPWSGIWVVGNDIANPFRNEEVTIKGEVQENFGMTRLSALNITKTGKLGTVAPSVINPSDSAAYAEGEWEKWESVLMSVENPGTGKIHVSQENLGFGDYAVSNTNTASRYNSARVLAGRQSSTAQSSLYVQIVADTIYNNLDGQMNVPAIEAASTMNMDALQGIMFYAFSNYRILPRNNDDFVNINVTLDSTNLPGSPISIVEYNSNKFTFFPNPATEVLHIQNSELNAYDVKILDMMGRVVYSSENNVNHIAVPLTGMQQGAYILHITDEFGKISTAKILIQ